MIAFIPRELQECLSFLMLCLLFAATWAVLSGVTKVIGMLWHLHLQGRRKS